MRDAAVRKKIKRIYLYAVRKDMEVDGRCRGQSYLEEDDLQWQQQKGDDENRAEVFEVSSLTQT